MKRKILKGFLLALVLAITYTLGSQGLVASALETLSSVVVSSRYDLEITEPTLEEYADGSGVFTAKATCSEDAIGNEIQVAMAFYNEDGRMVDCWLASYTLEAEGTITVTGAVPDYDKIGVYFFDVDTLIPIRPAVIRLLDQQVTDGDPSELLAAVEARLVEQEKAITLLKQDLDAALNGIESIQGTYTVEGEQVIIGVDAMKNSSTDRDAVAIGPGAMQNITRDGDNGRYNTAVGVRAMQAATTSDHSTALGFQALQNLTTGDANNGLGQDALLKLRTGSNNVAVGTHTGQELIDGSSNVFVGTSAGLLMQHGNFNTVIGMGACTTQFGSGYDMTQLYKSVVIGMAAGATVDNLTNVIVIGPFAKATADNQIIIGSKSHDTVKIAGKTIHFNEDGTVTWSE